MWSGVGGALPSSKNTADSMGSGRWPRIALVLSSRVPAVRCHGEVFGEVDNY
jgi:hypothetical protein